jgi:aspartate aminotransferase-like enzyme
MELFIPGPVSVRKDVLDAQTMEMIGHRSQGFKELFAYIEPILQEILFTKNIVIISSSSGSGLMEGAIRNCVSEKVLVCVSGAFGKKWASIAKSCGKKVDILESVWGSAISKEALAKKLIENNYDAVCITHNETSTGVMNNLEELVPIVKEKNALVLVDAVSSMAGSKIEVDKLGVDVCLTSSQKCFGLPAGLAFASVSEKALAKAQTVQARGYYFDFVELAKEAKENQTPYTPAISLMYATKKSLELIKEEGIEERFLRHKQLGEKTRSWAKQNGFELFVTDNSYSNTVTCITNTFGIDLKDLKKRLMTKGYFMDTGYGKLNEKLISEGKKDTFRIPHMAWLSEEELDKYLETIITTIKEMQ